ncbi:YbaK/EbsC family protein [Actinomycetospora soli]|uniref:YbaK/EbsC family protein n=1 Tax=Actinomycetospora soli TaxID=2893887 RepID=UPI001E4CE3E6|nr:YbaK/EbsC family protein [Actinomycetospora soli]MCD2189946.1 YbaK/EbsC family protein [Actinomycetospora soli]
MASALAAQGMGGRTRELPDSTRTAAEAGAALGCEVGQIVKSLVFRVPSTDAAVLVLASGSTRVDVGKLAAVVGEPVEQATGSFVRERTGFAIGGVAPVGLVSPVTTYVERGVLAWDRVWAAAGSPRTVFDATPSELVDATGGTVVDAAE